MPRRTNRNKCVYPYPTYEAHFGDNRVLRMSFWSKAGQPFDFEAGRAHCEIAMLAPAVDGYVEHDDPGKPWVRVRDPHFTGEIIETVKPRINGVKLKKAALRIVEQSANGGITPKAMQDLHEALNIAA